MIFFIYFFLLIFLFLAFPQVAGFIASLKMFLNYGVSSKSYVVFPEVSQRNNIHSTGKNLNFAESSKSNFAPYRPPHLRKKEPKSLGLNDGESLSLSEPESSTVYQTSSDSDYGSDGDGPGQDLNNVHCDRTRLAAIVCIQVSICFIASAITLNFMVFRC